MKSWVLSDSTKTLNYWVLQSTMVTYVLTFFLRQRFWFSVRMYQEQRRSQQNMKKRHCWEPRSWIQHVLFETKGLMSHIPTQEPVTGSHPESHLFLPHLHLWTSFPVPTPAAFNIRFLSNHGLETEVPCISWTDWTATSVFWLCALHSASSHFEAVEAARIPAYSHNA